VLDVMFNRARAETQAGTGDFLFHGIDTLRRLRSVDPRSVPRAGGMYAGVIGLFTYAPISPRVSEVFLRQSEPLVNPDDVAERFLFESMRFFHHSFAGDWSESYAIDPELCDEALRIGQLWDVTTYLAFRTKQLAHQGRFAEAFEGIEALADIEDRYGYELARQNRLATTSILHLERGEIDAASAATDEYVELHEEAAPLIFALGLRAKARAMAGDLEGSKADLDRARSTASKVQGLLPPFHRSSPLRAELLCGTLVATEGMRAPKNLRRLVRRASRTARRVASDRAETDRLSGLVESLAGRANEALRCLRRASAEAERLGMRPEAARVARDVAFVLERANPRPSAFEGIDSSEWLAHARDLAARSSVLLERSVLETGRR
jgi:tetratricopeptide (TPR) repeat protein